MSEGLPFHILPTIRRPSWVMIRSSSLDRSSSIRYWSSKAPQKRLMKANPMDHAFPRSSRAGKYRQFSRFSRELEVRFRDEARGSEWQELATNPGRNGVARKRDCKGFSRRSFPSAKTQPTPFSPASLNSGFVSISTILMNGILRTTHNRRG